MLCRDHRPGEVFALRKWSRHETDKGNVHVKAYIFFMVLDDVNTVSVNRIIDCIGTSDILPIKDAKKVWVLLREKGFKPCHPETGDILSL